MEDILKLNISENQKRRIKKLYTEKYFLLGFDSGNNDIIISGSTNNIYKIKININNLF